MYSLFIDYTVQSRNVQHALVMKVVQAWLDMAGAGGGRGEDQGEEREREHRRGRKGGRRGLDREGREGPRMSEWTKL